MSEMAGLAGVGLMYGVPAWLTVGCVIAAMSLMAYTGSYNSVERIAIFFGVFELVFLFVAYKSNPDAAAVREQVLNIPWNDSKYLYLVAANIGAVVMPWMVFFQQSAVVEKKLGIDDLPAARWDTAVGALLTQIVMAMVLIASAATIGKSNANASLDTVQQISEAITPFLGEQIGRLMFGMGIVGAALVAAIVVTLTAARALGEVVGYKHSLEHSPKEAPWFYAIYTAALILAGIMVASGINLVMLGVAVQVMNALLLPIVLTFLFLLARRLPRTYQLKGWYAWVTALTIGFTVILGVYAGLAGIFVNA